jgi:hypothetical protein
MLSAIARLSGIESCVARWSFFTVVILALTLSHLTFINYAGQMIAKSAARGHN